MRRALPFLLFGAVTLAVFWKFLLFGHTMLPVFAVEQQLGLDPPLPHGWFEPPHARLRVTDAVAVLLPLLRNYNEGLKRGELRLWNPALFCGAPAYADTMLHPFYPPQLLLHALLPPLAAYEIFGMLHLFFSGAALFWLLRGLGRSPPAATAGGLAWMLLGYSALWFSTGILAGVSVFGPLAMLGLSRGTRSAAALAGGAMGLAVLGSHPQYALFVFLFLVAWSARNRAAWPRVALFASLAVGVGLAAVLARLDSIANGYRNPELDGLQLYAYPWELPTYLAGLVFGKLWIPAPQWEFEFPVYAGLAVCATAVLAIVRAPRDRDVRFLAVVAAACLAVAFVAPLARLYLAVPFLNLSPPSRLIYPAGLSLVLLAARGIDALLERPGRVPVLLAGLAAASSSIFLFHRSGATAETVIGFALAAAAAFALTKHRPAGLALGTSALLFELLPPFLLTNWHADPAALRETPAELRGLVELGPWRATGLLGTSAPSTGDPVYVSDLVTGGNLLTLYGLETPGGFESIVPVRSMMYSLAAGAAFAPGGRTVLFTRVGSPLLDGAALRHVVLPAPLHPRGAYRVARAGPRVSVFENTAAVPRARLAARVRTVRDDEAARDLLGAGGEDVVETDGPPPSTGTGSVEWVERTSDRVLLDVHADGPSLLVLADTFYPGWEATVDGAPAPILPANVAFRAVPVPAGGRRVEFRFRPSCARAGVAGSILSGLAAVGLALRRSRP